MTLVRYILPAVALSIAPSAMAQLAKWLLRSGAGEVRTLDFPNGDPVRGGLIPSFGLGGNEDVNLMTDAEGNPLIHTAVGENNMVQVCTANFSLMPNGNGLIDHASRRSHGYVVLLP